MHSIDWTIIAIYLVWIVWDGLRLTKKSDELEGYFTSSVAPLLSATGGRPAASFRSVTGWRYQPHNARAFGPSSTLDMGIFVWFAHFPDAAAHRRHADALARDTTWQRRVEPMLRGLSSAPVEVWRLEPLPGSRVIY